ncbi:uncharacterized protein METZ01_LOCUS242327 [marine metagenome]|uniref:Uncharacterized protein n=1 Tax=marine metagenome TaxID=408172 RepID=A0A382HS79_9ZZZZ
MRSLVTEVGREGLEPPTLTLASGRAPGQ